ncbi:hypothetical protein PR202_ga05636 [Eleusine coracana subsp. coracana]|uniref:Uncharacterized protein n=1 Tax=Eleusine coracana subsp. coracana TaxID=191504 RepID=A0AAV5BRR6_ELECO|nr:hypothetical protein PR202_ga05182 [Eleusine coracana subsp. coracana]GJM89441.1 hypothetical protein PR202_ga05636 [Eleusine coracana subsp. coracana]
MVGPSWCRSLRLLFLALLLVLSAAAAALPPSPEPSTTDALLARMCDPRGTHRAAGAAPLSLSGNRHRHRHNDRPPVPLPPPGRGGEEEMDERFGVAKRLVPTGPNPLHN